MTQRAAVAARVMLAIAVVAMAAVPVAAVAAAVVSSAPVAAAGPLTSGDRVAQQAASSVAAAVADCQARLEPGVRYRFDVILGTCAKLRRSLVAADLANRLPAGWNDAAALWRVEDLGRLGEVAATAMQWDTLATATSLLSARDRLADSLEGRARALTWTSETREDVTRTIDSVEASSESMAPATLPDAQRESRVRDRWVRFAPWLGLIGVIVAAALLARRLHAARVAVAAERARAVASSGSYEVPVEVSQGGADSTGSAVARAQDPRVAARLDFWARVVVAEQPGIAPRALTAREIARLAPARVSAALSVLASVAERMRFAAQPPRSDALDSALAASPAGVDGPHA